MAEGRYCHGKAVISDRIMVMGGTSDGYLGMHSVEIYDPAKDEWFPAAPMLQPRKDITAGTVNDYVYVMGQSHHDSRLNPGIEKCSITKNDWERVSK